MALTPSSLGGPTAERGASSWLCRGNQRRQSRLTAHVGKEFINPASRQARPMEAARKSKQEAPTFPKPAAEQRLRMPEAESSLEPQQDSHVTHSPRPKTPGTQGTSVAMSHPRREDTIPSVHGGDVAHTAGAGETCRPTVWPVDSGHLMQPGGGSKESPLCRRAQGPSVALPIAPVHITSATHQRLQGGDNRCPRTVLWTWKHPAFMQGWLEVPEVNSLEATLSHRNAEARRVSSWCPAPRPQRLKQDPCLLPASPRGPAW